MQGWLIMFDMKLIVLSEYKVNKRTNTELKEYDLMLDDGRSVIADICEIFHESKKIKFHVSGFGQDSWPVDCLYDLTSIIEQIPRILKDIAEDESNFILDFYEQGIERTINFNLIEDNYILTCESNTDWNPIPQVITIKKQKIEIMLEQLVKYFLEYAGALCPFLSKQPLLVEWMSY